VVCHGVVERSRDEGGLRADAESEVGVGRFDDLAGSVGYGGDGEAGGEGEG